MNAIALDPQPASPGFPFWATSPREGFTQSCREAFGEFVLVDEISASEVEAYQRRSDLLATLVGVQQGKSNSAIRRAIELR